ncbi:restriction endonuclease subunit S [Bifidobacterium longum]|nr:restriction endonuclease subunit S [Bifidobacterium longum]
MMAEQAKVPAIRFAGFTDPWEQRKLGDVASSFDYGLNAAATEYDGQNKYLRITDIDDETHEFSKSDLTTPLADLAMSADYLLKEGDLLFARTGASVGKTYLYRQFDGMVYFAGFLIRARIGEGADPEFAYQATLTDAYKKYVAITSQRSGQPGVNAQEYADYQLMLPSKTEQQQIGMTLRSLDDLITLHQRKYDKLVIFKKSMLEKMFPKDGESVPEIRFAGFTDPWEQRKASEVFQIVDDRGHPTLPVLSATQNQGMIYRDDSGRYIGHDESNEIGYKRVLPGDFVVHLRSFQGGFAHSQYEGITSPAYTVFRAKEPTSHSDRFWKHWFMSEHFIAGLSTVTYGIRDGRSISVDEFMNTFLAFPAVEEQAAISRLFDYLDDLITLHQRKLELLQNIKKSLLDKMFV